MDAPTSLMPQYRRSSRCKLVACRSKLAMGVASRSPSAVFCPRSSSVRALLRSRAVASAVTPESPTSLFHKRRL
eukprot:5140866-Prymnesium_polylepis.1